METPLILPAVTVSLPFNGDIGDTRLMACEDDGAQRVSNPSLDVATDSIKATREVRIVPLTPPIAGAYVAGDAVGGLLTLPVLDIPGHSCRLQGLTVLDNVNAKVAADLLFFDSSPGGTTADSAAFAWGTFSKFIGRLPIAAADYVTVAGKASAVYRDLNLELSSILDSSLYAVFVTQGAPAYAAAGDLILKFTFEID